MNAILVIAHAPLASALRQAALHVFADCSVAVAALDVAADAAPEATLALARELMAQMPGDQLLVVTDIFGATPCNVAQKLVDGVDSRLLTGANLPMLLRAISYRHEPLEALMQRALSGGAQGVMAVSATSAPQNQIPRTHDPDQHHHYQ